MMGASFQFTLNGRPVKVEGWPSNTTLLSYLRSTGHTGTKQGCSEGDCGACTTAMVETNAHGERTFRAFNSCIALLPMVAGREIVTVEGVGSCATPHPVQTAMVKHYGSQCGFCTPGFVVSMFEAFYRSDINHQAQISDQLNGNLCRCTGYRPIRDALADALGQREERPNDVFRLQLLKPAPAMEPLAYEGFQRPASVPELLELRAAHPEAQLVAGATEIGVDITKKFRAFPHLISTEAIEELRSVRGVEGAWHIGGAATLTAIEEALGGAIPALDKMLWAFASRQIRNRATLAGNLVTASPIGDMAPVLLALDARIVLASLSGNRELPLEQFFLGYRKTALRPDEIVRTIIIPKAPEGSVRKLDSYKVSKRREMDISIAAACFCVELDSEGLVRRARLGYGGVAATPARAKRTEAALEGQPWNAETVARVLPILASEFSPIDDARGSAAYRRELITSLFEKFCSGAVSHAQDLPLTFDVGAPPAPAPPSFALKHESALGHATGSACYVDDSSQKQRMLEIWPVTSPHAHARLLRRDAAAARQMPGVAAVLLAEDIPGENEVGAIRKDESLIARDEVRFQGHIVAVVVGDSVAACRAAAEKVVVEYEPLPALLTIDEAIAQESFHTHPHHIRRGDCDASLARSPHTLSGAIEIGGQEHFYLETQAAYAELGDDGDVTVVSSTQHPSEIQAVVSHVLHIPRNKVVVQAPRMGGGFGGKETQGNTWAALVALAAWKTGRPTRVMLDRDLDMLLTGKRHPFKGRFEVGFDEEGRLLALRAQVVSNGGWALDLSESICDRALFHIDNAYYIPSMHVTGRVAKTNVVSHTAFRGFGGPQGMVIIEEVIDRIARELGLPPEVVRERNLYRGEGETNTTHYGQRLEDNRIPKIWQTLKASSRLGQRREEIARFNAASPRVKRGIAMTPVKFGISFTASFLNQAGALVVIYRDGSVQVNHGGTEMGQGLSTKILGIAMRELGLPADRVRVMKTSTDKVPNTSATAASAGADLNGAAVRNACVTLRERLAPVAAPMLAEQSGAAVDPAKIVFEDGTARYGTARVAFEKLAERAHFEQVSLSATGFYRTPGVHYDKAAGQGKPFHYFAYGAAVSEVEVDGFTGMKRLLRVDILHDVGDSLNPGIDRGQVEGGFVQGVGWLTGEELLWNAQGKLLTHSASTYQIPAIGDAPHTFNVTLLPDAAQANTIHGSKAVGEPPLMLALSVREALRDAVAAFGSAGGQVPLPSPATHEAIFLALQARREKQIRLKPFPSRRAVD
jgi:xanthine dehydrogenase molybdopterin binding subunit/xanthine dehydrogenase small subunit